MYVELSQDFECWNHCLISTEDLLCSGNNVLSVLVVKPGWWLSEAAWNKWLSFHAALFCSPCLSSLEAKAHKEMTPVARLALQGTSYRREEHVCKIKWQRGAGQEIRSRQKPTSQGSAILRGAFEKLLSTAILLFSTLIALRCESPYTISLK